MSLAEEIAREQMAANDPEIKAGQVWDLIDNWADGNIPRRIRIVSRYPFGRSADGRSWVVERNQQISALDRLPELTLRQLYELGDDV